MPIGQAKFGLLGGVADLGKLELITSYTLSSGNNAGFNNLASNPYNIYLLTMNNVKTLADNVQLRVRFSTTNGSTEVVSGYNYAFQRATTGSLGTTFQEVKSQNNNFLGIHNDTGNNTNETVNGYIYLYNLLDSSNYSYLSHHLSGNNKDGQYSMAFGGGVNRNAQTVNSFNIGASSNFLASGDFALYGLKES